MGVQNVGEVTCPSHLVSMYRGLGLNSGSLDAESILPSLTLHRLSEVSHKHLEYFKSKANREELGEMEEEASPSLCWTP